mgnify:FL=1
MLVIMLLIVPVALIGWYVTGKTNGKRTYSTDKITVGNIRNFISASGSLAAITTV